MNKILTVIIFGLLVTSCGNNKETKSISHCSDIKFISNANNNPHLFIDPSKVIAETKIRDKKIKEWIKINHDPNDLVSIGKLKDKMNANFNDINFPLSSEILFLGSKWMDITMLNDKTRDWHTDHKKKELTNYAEFHLECWNEYKRDNGYHSKDFINKYLEWQKQDVSNLNTYYYKVFDDLQIFSKKYQFTTKIWETQKKIMDALRPL
jgi:hypothetical protein